MQGKIIKGIGGFYYVYVEGRGIYECRAKGIFRRDKIRPMVGDDVDIEETDPVDIEGNIVRILPRRNELIRPAVANIDQALVIFAAANPEPNLNLLDRFLVMMEYADVPVVICVNKIDLVTEEVLEQFRRTYEPAGYEVRFISAKEEIGIDEIRVILAGKTSTVAGPSGVGKSSFINRLQQATVMEIGGISAKLHRGRHTTRHSELIPLPKRTAGGCGPLAEISSRGEEASPGSGTFQVNAHFAEDDAHVWIPAELTDGAVTKPEGFIMDTPGFSSLYVPEFEKEDLTWYFPEFVPYLSRCRFQGCAHIHEPDCAVRLALEEGKIAKSRYESYVQMYGELADRRKY